MQASWNSRSETEMDLTNSAISSLKLTADEVDTANSLSLLPSATLCSSSPRLDLNLPQVISKASKFQETPDLDRRTGEAQQQNQVDTQTAEPHPQTEAEEQPHNHQQKQNHSKLKVFQKRSCNNQNCK